MALDAITREQVREALRAIRYARPLPDSALLDLDLVTAQLHAEDLADTRRGRAYALGRCLADAVDTRLRRLRGDPSDQAGSGRPDTAALTAEAEIQQLREDLQSGHTERLDWALLRWRYLSLTRQPVQSLAHPLGLTDRTIRNRLARGVDGLTRALREHEVEAARRQAGPARLPLPERVVVDERAADRGIAALLAEIEALARCDTGSLRASQAQIEAVACYPAAELVAYWLGRIAEWCLPRYRLDSRFVELSLLVDLGEESQSGRWKAREERFGDLRALLAATAEPAVVLLGPPGSGKSTLLRRLELDLSRDALGPDQGDGPDRRDGPTPLTFFVSLNQFRPTAHAAPLPAPMDWLAERWTARFPKMPPLAEVAPERGIVFLLDGLNEMPHRSPEDYRARIALWKQFLLESVTPGSGHRAVIACRSLDYSAPLSSPALRVPHVQIEPLSDAKVEAFLQRYSPANAAELWEALRGTALLKSARWPLFLRLLVEDAAETGRLENGLAAVMTAYVRRALLREVERGNPRIEPGALVDARDYERVASRRAWRRPYELPERGSLFRRLSELAHGMQASVIGDEQSQLRIGYPEAQALLDGDGATIIRIGEDLGLLDEDPSADEVMFQHQLMQEYFAARRMAREPNVELVRQAWRAAEIRPSVGEVIESLGPGEALPPLPGTGWEETARMAAVMAEDPSRFLDCLAEANLAVAGRAAAQPELAGRLPEDRLDALRWALVKRSRDPEADLRDRIACGLALGDLGDPRFERRVGPFGEYLMPPLVAIPGGRYPIGDDEPIEWLGGMSDAQMPRHEVEIAAFEIGQFPVTNAEWALFMAAGGYEDERWWDTAAGRDWRRGVGSAADTRANFRYWVARIQADPEFLDRVVNERAWDQAHLHHRIFWLQLSEEEIEDYLHEMYPDSRYTEPRRWGSKKWNCPNLPVVGISWYEARAFTRWLSEQSGRPFRLPTEVEWEAAARGKTGRRYAFGNDPDYWKANTWETHVMRTTPVGIYPDGDTPDGVCDLAGNVFDWTSSQLESDEDETFIYGYPYDAADGREASDFDAKMMLGMRGCGYAARLQPAALRLCGLPADWNTDHGMRVAVSTPAKP